MKKKNTENYEPGSINDFRRNTFCLILEYCEWCNIKQINFQFSAVWFKKIARAFW